MKATAAVATFLLLLAATYWSFESATPFYRPDADAPAGQFSTDRALEHVRAISQKPHAVGFPAHSHARDYLVGALGEMGLEVEIQSGYTGGDWGNLSRAVNILARIPGQKPGKSLVLLSHYDSAPHSSYGASDAGSGVAVILEAVRAYLASGEVPENDVLVLFSDAEELGLNGADLFVNRHARARDVGLVLNFEARGSGGPGIMFIETNGGNARLVEAFANAGVAYPSANSLVYSIYKMLPNDTDLTVFREDGDIQGFNFAFIDDHYDYHTAMDSYERLDRRTLAHQGSYLVPLLAHFANADLDNLRDSREYVYFNLPFFGLIYYPFGWIWALWALAALAFVVTCYFGFRRGAMSWRGLCRGFIPLLLCLAFNGLAGFYAWPILLKIYPEYADILHGFTYNGYLYIAAWAALAVGSSFLVYRRFRKIKPADILVAPVFFWLLLCALLNAYLPGAAFFLIPGIALLLSLLVTIYQEKANPFVLAALAIPAIWILAPMVKQFPVGLGLKMMVAGSLVTCFIFLLGLGIFFRYPNKGRFGWLGILLFAILSTTAHFKSGYSEAQPEPTSLLYVLDADTGSTQWATYDRVISPWTRSYLGEGAREPDALNEKIISSKYDSGFSLVADAPAREIPIPEILVESDTVVDNTRKLVVTHYPRRPVNRLEVYTASKLHNARVNGIPFKGEYLAARRGPRLVTHYISDHEPTQLELELPAGEPLELTFYEASNDLLSNERFTIPPRPVNAIPKPFVLNDAILVVKTLKIE